MPSDRMVSLALVAMVVPVFSSGSGRARNFHSSRSSAGTRLRARPRIRPRPGAKSLPAVVQLTGRPLDQQHARMPGAGGGGLDPQPASVSDEVDLPGRQLLARHLAHAYPHGIDAFDLPNGGRDPVGNLRAPAAIRFLIIIQLSM